MRRACHVLIATAVLALAGCADVPSGPPVGVPGVRPAEPLQRFALEGRLQVKDGERLAAVGVSWRHERGHDEWLFTGPLGQGLARLESGPEGARLSFADGRHQDAAAATELAAAVLGVEAPFEALPAWVTARLREGAEARAVDAVARPTRVVDAGWTVEYVDYVGPEPDARPRRIDIHRGDTRLRLVVDDWNP